MNPCFVADTRFQRALGSYVEIPNHVEDGQFVTIVDD